MIESPTHPILIVLPPCCIAGAHVFGVHRVVVVVVAEVRVGADVGAGVGLFLSLTCVSFPLSSRAPGGSPGVYPLQTPCDMYPFTFHPAFKGPDTAGYMKHPLVLCTTQ